jgi:hypothetical protein
VRHFKSLAGCSPGSAATFSNESAAAFSSNRRDVSASRWNWGNVGVIIHQDPDVAYAAERVTWGGFSYAG